MDQPPSFTISTSHIGLLQAPRVWYHELRNFLLCEGFTNSYSDTTLFILHSPTSVLSLLVYVDDIIITGSSDAHLSDFIFALAR